jgi:hypothetical protein
MTLVVLKVEEGWHGPGQLPRAYEGYRACADKDRGRCGSQ